MYTRDLCIRGAGVRARAGESSARTRRGRRRRATRARKRTLDASRRVATRQDAAEALAAVALGLSLIHI